MRQTFTSLSNPSRQASHHIAAWADVDSKIMRTGQVLRGIASTMSFGIKEQKAKLRKDIRAALSQLSTENIAEQSRLVGEKVMACHPYQNAKSISIFLSMPGREVSTASIVIDALRQDKKVFIPYIYNSPNDQNRKEMEMLRIKDEQDLNTLRPDAWGIPSISADDVEHRENLLGGYGISGSAKSDATTKLDLMLMPGVAFDADNNRLGHGKGFYDQYLTRFHTHVQSSLSTKSMPYLVALALREQLLTPEHHIPVDQNDWKIDKLVTPDVG